MSLLEAKTRVVERAVPASDWGEVGVRAESGDQIVVKWLCGETRTFDREQLRGIIDDLELLQQYPDVWFEGRDAYGSRFAARVLDGRFYADSVPRQTDGGSCVPWKALRKALVKA